MPRLSLIVAMTRNRVIGRDNTMPWHLPADLRRFRELTWGRPILMGRKTHASIGRPLPGRRNIVLTRDPTLAIAGVECVGSIADALVLCQDADWVHVIGGAEVYRQSLPLAQRLHITEIDAELDGDTLFPEFDQAQWVETGRAQHTADARNAYDLQFVTLDMRRGQG